MMGMISELQQKVYKLELAVKTIQKAIEINDVKEIDLESESWEQIKLAAEESCWIPNEYFMNDWVSDVCKFLREGK